jgi:hypothetical protein
MRLYCNCKRWVACSFLHIWIFCLQCLKLCSFICIVRNIWTIFSFNPTGKIKIISTRYLLISLINRKYLVDMILINPFRSGRNKINLTNWYLVFNLNWFTLGDPTVKFLFDNCVHSRGSSIIALEFCSSFLKNN